MPGENGPVGLLAVLPADQERGPEPEQWPSLPPTVAPAALAPTLGVKLATLKDALQSVYGASGLLGLLVVLLAEPEPVASIDPSLLKLPMVDLALVPAPSLRIATLKPVPPPHLRRHLRHLLL